MATMMDLGSPKKPTPSLCGIPQELKSTLCGFLTAHDIAALSKTCSKLRDAFRYSLLSPLKGDINVLLAAQGDQPVKGQELLIPLNEMAHSVRLEFSWRGHSPTHGGTMWIIGKNCDSAGSSATASEPFDGGRVVFQSAVATNTAVKVVIWFSPRSHERYFIWHQHNAGRARFLLVSDGKLQVFCRDDEDWNLRTNYEALVRADAIPKQLQSGNSFYYDFLKASIDRAIEMHETHGHGIDDLYLDALLRPHGLTTSLPGLKMLRLILDDIQLFAVRKQLVVLAEQQRLAQAFTTILGGDVPERPPRQEQPADQQPANVVRFHLIGIGPLPLFLQPIPGAADNVDAADNVEVAGN